MRRVVNSERKSSSECELGGGGTYRNWRRRGCAEECAQVAGDWLKARAGNSARSSGEHFQATAVRTRQGRRSRRHGGLREDPRSRAGRRAAASSRAWAGRRRATRWERDREVRKRERDGFLVDCPHIICSVASEEQWLSMDVYFWVFCSYRVFCLYYI